MSQSLDQIKIYNIAANYHFLNSLADFVLSKLPASDIVKSKILLPNRRLVKEFKKILSKKIAGNNKAVILPKIKAISDISFDDFIDNFANHQNPNLLSRIEEISKQLSEVKIGSEIEHLLFLSKKIKDWQEATKFFGSSFNNSQSLNIAINLLNLFNQSHKDEVDLSDLSIIDDSESSLHRQFILEFLQKFYLEIKNSLLKNNITSITSYQNLIINQFSDFIKEFGHVSPIIIAGSTGSIKATKKLIKTILEAENGLVITYGFDVNYRINGADLDSENHPQFTLNSLIDYLQIENGQITEITNCRYLLSPDSRRKLVQAAMLPAKQITKWQNIISQVDDFKLLASSLKNITLINAKNEIEEAKIIAIALKEAEINNQQSALITNDQTLSFLVKLELQKLNVKFNDAANNTAMRSKLINFILLILDLLNDYDSSKFLSLIKNDLCFLADKEFAEEILLFEIEVIRKPRASSDLNGIKIAIDNLQNRSLINNFAIIFTTFTKLQKLLNQGLSLAKFSHELIAAIENLSKKNFTEILNEELANQEIFDFFTNLTSAISNANLIEVEKSDILPLFKTLFSQISYFEESSKNCLIQILPTIEARQLNHDLTIISSLNEGSFPELTKENWLGRKIKKDLKIDKNSKQIGINCYDFCNHLGNNKVILTRSISNKNSPTNPSRFILKLQSLIKKINLDFDDGAIYFETLKYLNQQLLNNSTLTIARPDPKPPINYRPTSYAITDIAKLINDPYAIYAKKILKLKPLNKIDYESANAEFGSFVHEVLEKYIKAKDQKINDFLIQAKKIFFKYFPNPELELIWWPKFENIFTSFVSHESEFKGFDNKVELPVKLILNTDYNQITINGKIDRILIQNNLATIIDYKTGYSPTKNEVISGSEPQLTIAALTLKNDKNFSNLAIANLEYWKLSFSKENEYYKIFKNQQELELAIIATESMLKNLFNYFFDHKKLNGYIACYDLKQYQENDYKYLARIDEWNL